MKIRSAYTYPLETVHDIIKGKWKLILILNHIGLCGQVKWRVSHDFVH